jgi:hypothetical protein
MGFAVRSDKCPILRLYPSYNDQFHGIVGLAPPTQHAGDNGVGDAGAVACGATPGNMLVRSHQQKLAAVDPDEIGRVAS